MDNFKYRLVLLLLLVVFPVAIFSEIVLSISAAKKMALAKIQYESKAVAVDLLREVEPYPDTRNLAAIKKHRELLTNLLESLNRKLTKGAISSVELQDRYAETQDLYFDLFKFVENYRKRASEAGINLSDNENFTFGSLLTNKSEIQIESAGELYGQQLVLGKLLDILFDAKPDRLVSVQRESISMAGKNIVTRNISLKNEEYFSQSHSIASNVEEVAVSFGVCIAFTGRTENLRKFLAGLYALEMPIRVQSVEVIPSSDGFNEGNSSIDYSGDSNAYGIFENNNSSGKSSIAVPIVEENSSVFTVVLEYFELETNAREEGNNPGGKTVGNFR